MKTKSKNNLNHCLNIIFPTLVFSAITGGVTAAVVVVYKFLAAKVIGLSEQFYHNIGNYIWLVPVVIVFLFLAAFLLSKIYAKNPDIKGGGIPTSIGALRGLFNFKWKHNLIGVFFISLFSFLIGVPLGNEGPSVQMGTAIGKGTVNLLAKKHSAWDRYVMTGGACAGFSSATGASLSGILFAIEEAHGRISPMIIMVSVISVLFSRIVTEILCPIFSVSVSLFPKIDYLTLDNSSLWLPLCVGVALGVFAVLFLRYFGLLASLYSKCSKKFPAYLGLFLVFILTLIFGSISPDFISTGHELIIDLFNQSPVLIFLVLILLIRTTLTLFANVSGVTGGIFLPLLALGAVWAGIFGELLFSLGVSREYYSLIIALGIVGCIAGMMKMPLTAILFGVEVLGFGENILFALICSAAAYLITEIFAVESIGDYVLDHRIHSRNKGVAPKTVEREFVIEKNSFAVGKEIRDIFWPNKLKVLSVEKADPNSLSHFLSAGDIITVHYTTFDEEKTLKELSAVIDEIK